MSRIVIIGGHGKVALLLAPLLAARGDEVVGLVRNPAHFTEVTTAGAEPRLLSVEDAGVDALTAAFAGADAIVWSAGAGGKGGPERTHAVDELAAIRTMEAAHAAGVRRYLMVSWIGSRSPEPVPEDHPLRAYAMAKLAADRYLAESDLEWTILGPGTLTFGAPSGLIEVGLASGSAPTSRANVAAVAVAALADDSTIGKILPFRDGSTPIAEAIARAPQDSRI